MDKNVKHVFDLAIIAKARGTKDEERINGTRKAIDQNIAEGTMSIALQLVTLNAFKEVTKRRPLLRLRTKRLYDDACREIIDEYGGDGDQ